MLLPSATARSAWVLPLEGQPCGPDHPILVRQVMVARNPNAAGPEPDGDSTLRFNRGVIIRDFLRLRAERGAVVSDAVRALDLDHLLRDADSGRLTPESCAVVQFMSEYYGRPDGATGVARAYLRGDEWWSVAVTTVAERPPVVVARAAVSRPPAPALAKLDAVSPPQPQAVLQAPSAVEPPPALVPAPPPTLGLVPARVLVAEPEAEPEDALPASAPVPFVVLAPVVHEAERRARTERDERVARIARALIVDLEQQLGAAPYLSFREVRVLGDKLSDEEVEELREASLRASRQVLRLLATLQQAPALLDAVQVALGVDGRERVEAALERSLRSQPGDEQRARARRMWDAFEALARPRQLPSVAGGPAGGAEIGRSPGGSGPEDPPGNASDHW